MLTSPPSRISRERAPHYVWGEGCDGWHLVQGTGVSVIEERMPSGTAEARHRHVRARQFFYVLTGQLELELEGVRHRLAAREGLEVPPGMAHQVRNVGDDVAEFLVIAAPPVGADRVPAPLES